MTESKPGPLISAAELLGRLDDPRLRIADVRWFLGEPGRGREEYAEGHIPGAVYVDLDHDLAAPPGEGRHPLPDPTAFADRMGELGFGDGHTIVIYDADVGQYGARLWWMLDRLGHREVYLLDGGIKAWQAADGPWTVERSSPMRADLTLAKAWPGIIDRAGVADAGDTIDLVDVRAAERYRGEVEPMEHVAGHIPGARNRPCASMVTSDGHILSPGELRPLIRGTRDRRRRPLVISCGSGVTACFGILAARVAGLPDPILYPGSYSDWVGAGLPVATGPNPKGPLAGTPSAGRVRQARER
jgi:thiosulfate/3-mercaptopyruvate sulfurtransferase